MAVVRVVKMPPAQLFAVAMVLPFERKCWWTFVVVVPCQFMVALCSPVVVVPLVTVSQRGT